MTYIIGIATQVGVYLIAILGVSVICGFTGMFSMGHAGFMAIGAYDSALLSMRLGFPVPVSILCGTLLSTVFGVLISLPTLKLRDDYFLIVTLGVGEGVRLVIQNLTDLTGGARELTSIPKFTNIWIVLVCLILTVVFIRAFLQSKFGRNCIAIREEELAAKSVGISVFHYKLIAMTISCVLCGLSGGLLAHYMGYLTPNLFKMVKSEELIIPVILGGRGSLTGTIIAGLLLLPLPELLRFGSAQEWRMVVYALLVIFVITFRPSGLLGTKELTLQGIQNTWRKLVNWRRSSGKGEEV